LKIGKKIGSLALLLLVPGLTSAQSGPGWVRHGGTTFGRNVHAALILSGGENARCQFGNANDAWIVTVSSPAKPGITRYISGVGQGCAVLPITLATGTELDIAGILQQTAAIPGGPNAPAELASITEDCFNVEGFSVGLTAGAGSEFDPNDPSNIINGQGYGFFWYDSDADLKPGPYSYTVSGCSGTDCPIVADYFNTDNLSGPASCTVLKPFPQVGQRD
jgi:hypothetical protein